MKTYDWDYGGMIPAESWGGAYVLYEEARLIEVDRDIKAANLQLLVENVLAIDVDSDKGTWEALEVALDLARSLKQ